MSRVLPSATGFITNASGLALKATFLLALVAAGVIAMTNDPSMNTLTAKEKAEGWKLLFDGKSLNGWRAFKVETPPDIWKVIDGEIRREPGKGGDLVTAGQFDDFELRLEWKLSTTGGNSGIMFRVTDGEQTYHSGPEVQILDNAVHRDGRNPARSAGSNYDMHAAVRDVTKAVGEWNEIRLVVNGAHVEHWMNGVKLLEYELGSEDWEKRYQASKFKEWPGYGRAKRGYIVLQDHGNPVAFRNIKIRAL